MKYRRQCPLCFQNLNKGHNSVERVYFVLRRNECRVTAHSKCLKILRSKHQDINQTFSIQLKDDSSLVYDKIQEEKKEEIRKITEKYKPNTLTQLLGLAFISIGNSLLRY